ncbi:MAG TPA: aminoglycoside phosphotransferase family protein [Chthoniobacterales bacterium]|jgi:aminoglycoside/choline kinase family phosphotransferase
MTTDLLLRRTRLHFPRVDFDKVEITPIEKGGSDRRFYRICCSPEQSLILVKYNLEREENRHYVEIAQFLAEHGIRAPKIYYHDPDEGLIWIEDLGERDLFSYRAESWMVRRVFYESAIDEILKLHRLPESICEEMREHLPAEFNAALYLWEQSYFFENCFGRYFKIDNDELATLSALPVLSEIADRLSAQPRLLVHRDFQSQNIMMRNGQAYLIDFQGMRPGLAQYDLASLLYDPYVDLGDGERDELLAYYCGGKVSDDFRETLRLCAMQRLMQALGAYGYLGLVKGHEHFLQHIPAAMKSLCAIVSALPALEQLAASVCKLSEERIR